MHCIKVGKADVKRRLKRRRWGEHDGACMTVLGGCYTGERRPTRRGLGALLLPCW